MTLFWSAVGTVFSALCVSSAFQYLKSIRVTKVIRILGAWRVPMSGSQSVTDARHEVLMKISLCFVIPSVVLVLVWNGTISNAILTQWFIRFIIFFNAVFCVNSVAHLWGSRPYNRSIRPEENLMVSCITLGEGSHNYHHTFPWDYKTSELPYTNFNPTTLFIETMAKLRWAYDRRQVSPTLVKQVIERIRCQSEIHRDDENIHVIRQMMEVPHSNTLLYKM